MTPEPKKPGREPGKITKIPREDRRKTYAEVSHGFNEQEALKEAARCIQCKNATCIQGCPAGVDVKSFINDIKTKDFRGAIAKIKENNSLPGVCGRVCPQEDQCQKTCVFNKKGEPVQIGYLERFVADWELSGPPNPPAKIDRPPSVKVAVIGAGPAGLTCAADLAREGFDVHLFEALHKAGGVLVYGIPEFRLPKDIVAAEVRYIQSLGVTLRTDFVAGKTRTLDDLRREGFKAFFIGVGAGLPRRLNVPGENLNGIYSANEFLTRVNLMKGYRFPEYDTPVNAGKRVGVFGAGNVALDSARCALHGPPGWQLDATVQVVVPCRLDREGVFARPLPCKGRGNRRRDRLRRDHVQRRHSAQHPGAPLGLREAWDRHRGAHAKLP